MNHRENRWCMRCPWDGKPLSLSLFSQRLDPQTCTQLNREILSLRAKIYLSSATFTLSFLHTREGLLTFPHSNDVVPVERQRKSEKVGRECSSFQTINDTDGGTLFSIRSFHFSSQQQQQQQHSPLQLTPAVHTFKPTDSLIFLIPLSWLLHPERRVHFPPVHFSFGDNQLIDCLTSETKTAKSPFVIHFVLSWDIFSLCKR